MGMINEVFLQFGVAGLMGALWVWERMHSRRREEQLTAAHEKLLKREQELDVLTDMVRQNTEALVGFERSQKRMCDVLERIRDEMCSEKRAA